MLDKEYFKIASQKFTDNLKSFLDLTENDLQKEINKLEKENERLSKLAYRDHELNEKAGKRFELIHLILENEDINDVIRLKKILIYILKAKSAQDIPSTLKDEFYNQFEIELEKYF
jgi:hypothetical protein